MNSKAVVVAFHRYQPYGGEFYQPILDHFIKQMRTYQDEYDCLYLVDSNWEIGGIKEEWGLKNVKIIRVDPHLRYYDVYKKVLPEVEEDLVLFMDNDMVVYKPNKIRGTFSHLEFSSEHPDVVSIYDTIGEYKTDKLNGKNKMCPYWFATRKDTLMKYLDIVWAPDMPYCETLGYLTEAILDDGLIPFEWEEDKSSIYFDRTKDGDHGLDLGWYHIRAGSTPALLLAYKKYDPDKYVDYIDHQPEREYLRQFAWYDYMGGTVDDEFLRSVGISRSGWNDYMEEFREYHGL